MVPLAGGFSSMSLIVLLRLPFEMVEIGVEAVEAVRLLRKASHPTRLRNRPKMPLVSLLVLGDDEFDPTLLMTRYVSALEHDAKLCMTLINVVDGNLSPCDPE